VVKRVEVIKKQLPAERPPPEAARKGPGADNAAEA
jgi:hypothetical protein